MNISEFIYNEGLDLGYSRIGAMELKYIENQAIKSIKEKHTWAKSMIIGAFHYNFYKIPSNLEGIVSKRDLFIGRYLEGSTEYETVSDFEEVLTEQGIKYLDFTNLSVSIKNSIATQMNIGITRTNGYFYTEEGSYCHLHVWLIDKELTCDFDQAPTACPGHCSICVRTCPQTALTKTSKDHSKCIEFKTDKATPDYTIGCDLCQDLCPYNKDRWEYEEDFIHFL